ncbi:pseudaminic acid synthase [Shewanella bicestrii]|uniref:Pseudaminic acid synthase n=1 Tax=Shewanella bicestrii TaxID=2018305 RepID=A0A220UPA4_9GAMM|nr:MULTISPECIES: pseudaminic acid synthase [Shewanella]ABK47538.1 N-acetylneuraminate synthase [Shewanella sp. ANA-3]ASK69945.1 pseudaminic acid synthase [Shewanella bicestrii]
MTHPMISISGRKIGIDYPPYIVAELSANHNGDIERAKQIIAMAKRCNADAIKLQTYSADTITLNSKKEEFMIRGGLWDGKSLYELYQWAQMPWEWHKPLFDYARNLGITIFSSPFDNTAVDLLEDLNAPVYKVASFEAIDLPLIKYIAGTGKPMIISTGMANRDEIAEAVEAARSGGCNELALLHCVSSYPAPSSEYNLKTIADLAKRFNVVGGLSDHTIDNVTAVTSVAVGAAIIEKHVTLDRNSGGPDDSFSIEEVELERLCTDAKIAWQALGKVDYSQQNSEKATIKYRRSLYIVNDKKAGELILQEDIRSVRPGFGLAPKFYEQIIGRKLTTDVSVNSPVSWSMFE